MVAGSPARDAGKEGQRMRTTPPPYTKKQVELPTSLEAKYIAEQLGVALTLGLADVASARPRDPVDHLAQYLYRFSNNTQDDKMVSTQSTVNF